AKNDVVELEAMRARAIGERCACGCDRLARTVNARLASRAFLEHELCDHAAPFALRTEQAAAQVVQQCDARVRPHLGRQPSDRQRMQILDQARETHASSSARLLR